MAGSNALGEFLRARRDQLRPQDAGLRAAGPRRVPGLRREEVAMLAGISTDYYLRLEQGRDRTPSAQVLDALAQVLMLDQAETVHLHGLARPRSRRVSRSQAEKVPAGTLRLLESLPMPAFVQNRYTDVLAANDVAGALSPNMRPGSNRLIASFLDPRERDLYHDWEQATAAAVGHLRAVVGADADDARFSELVGELSMKSERFRQLWARHDVRRGTGGPVRLRHPEVGDLALYLEKLAVNGTNGLMLAVYHADPDTDSAHSLHLLGSLAAGDPDRATGGGVFAGNYASTTRRTRRSPAEGDA